MKSLFFKKIATLIGNIEGNIFENIVGYITAARLKNVLNDTISVIQEVNKRSLKIARWNFSVNTQLSAMIAGATINGTVLYEDDIILLSKQAETSENGLWLIVAGAAPVRPDFFNDTETQKSFVWVSNMMAGQKERLFTTDISAGAISVTSYFEEALSYGGSFRGILMIATEPSIPGRGTAFFMAGEKGTYAKAGGVIVTSDIAIIQYTAGIGWTVTNIAINIPTVFSAADRTKFDTIAPGAEVNVQADFDITDNTSDAFIKNKPIQTKGVFAANGIISFKNNPVLAGALTANKTISFSDYQENRTVSLSLTGNYALTLPGTVVSIAGEYNGVKNNFIQFLCVNSTAGAEKVICTINSY